MPGESLRLENPGDVDRIPDLITAIKFMKDYKIPYDNKITTSDARRRIAAFLATNGPDVAKINRLKAQNALEAALNEDKANRMDLTSLYDKASKFFKELPPRFRDDLGRVFTDFQNTLKHKSELLKKSDCAIFVAGDTGSGKSTLINLLVGMQILPTSALQCTASLCELRCAPTGSFVLHYKDKKSSKTVKCPDSRGFEEFQKKLTECIRETNDDDESPYERIEINYPFPMMQEGVVFVDTPGIGGSYCLDLQNYMDKALGFIYVINTGDAGGIHRDRLGRLLSQAIQQDDFDPATAIFVCNKWDQVGRGEDERVRDFIRDKLRTCIPTVSRRQIYKISASQALGVLDFQKMDPDHVTLVEGIRKVLPTTFHSNLSSHYRWLGSVLKRTIYSLKVTKQLDARNVQEMENMYRNVCLQIEQLETRAENRVRDMRRDVKQAVDDISKAALRTLKSAEIRGNLMVWKSDLCPRPDKWKKVAAEASGLISGRVQEALDTWERQKDVVGSVRLNIIKKFQKDVELFEDQTKKIEGEFLGEDVRSLVDLHSSMRVRAPVRSVWRRANKQGGRDEGFLSLGSAVGAAALLDPRSSKVKALFRSYEHSRAPQIMQEATDLFLSELTEKNVMSSVEKFFERDSKSIDKIGHMLPEFLRADRQLMKSLVEDVKSTNQKLVNEYPRFIQESVELQGRLDMFYATKLAKFDFAYRELNLSPNDTPIGTGSFAKVYFSKIEHKKQELMIALKVCKDPLDIDNVTDVLLEDNTLRDLDHRNIVKYYGSSCEVTRNELKWIMVLEYCPKTLQEKFVGRQADSPSKHSDIYALKIGAMKTVAKFAAEICCGLEYLHAKGLVHRDMKPDNILLDADDVVKLTDVGLAKRVQEISGTIAGSPVYMAPEVLLQTERYDFKADMYSMGIILWEMWYGLDAADHIKTQLFTTFERALEKGLRPSMTLTEKPPEDWRELIVKCWDIKPAKRPTSSVARAFFQNFLKQNC